MTNPFQVDVNASYVPNKISLPSNVSTDLNFVFFQYYNNYYLKDEGPKGGQSHYYIQLKL